MAKNFKSFVFPETIKKQIDQMPDMEMKFKFYEAVTNYGMYDCEPQNLNSLEQIIWISMKDLLDNSKAGRAGAPLGNCNAKKTNETTECFSSSEKQLKTIENNQNNQNNQKTIETIKTTLINGNGNDNDNVNDNHTHNVNACVCENNQNQETDIQDWRDFQTQSYELIQNHNKTSEYSKKLCISNSFSSYLQKECRELISGLNGEKPPCIYKALQNYLLVAKSDTWKKTFSVKNFISEYAAFSDKDFTVSKYLTNDAQKEKANVPELTPEELEKQLLVEMNGNPEFIPDIFSYYKDDWKEDGCPLGSSYMEFQRDKELMPYGQKLKAMFDKNKRGA